MIIGLCSLLDAGPKSVGGLSGSASPPLRVSSGNGTVTSGSLTANHTGGTAPFTYQWQSAGGPPGITITSPTSQTTTTSTTVSLGDFIQGFLTCTITDNAGLVLTTNQVTLQFQYAP